MNSDIQNNVYTEVERQEGSMIIIYLLFPLRWLWAHTYKGISLPFVASLHNLEAISVLCRTTNVFPFASQMHPLQFKKNTRSRFTMF